VSKRLKILLIVLGALLILGAGSAAFFIMTGEAPEEPAQVAMKPKTPAPSPTPKPSPKPKAEEGGEQAAPAGKPAPKPAPAPAAEQETAASEAKPTAKPAPKPEVKAEAPKPPASSGSAKPAGKPATAGKEAAEAPKPPEKKCVPVITTVVKGKKTDYKTPDEFVKGAGMKPKEFRDFSEKFLADKQKSLDDLKKAKGTPKEDIECAEKFLALAKSLDELVNDKFPRRPEKKVYTYLSLDKRDPFMSPFQIPKNPCKVPYNAPPVQQQPAETLKVEGIMWNEKGYRALMITEDGRGFTVKVGDGAGNKCGKITKITPTKVTITEWIPDIFDNIEVRETVIGLHN